MKVLYLTNYPVPYRVEFFNQLARKVNLTVWYETTSTDLRDEAWQRSNAIRHTYLTKADTSLRQLISDQRYDLVIVGCYNEMSGLKAIALLKLLRRKYLVNVDGEFLGGAGVKKRFRDFMVKGADGYLIAGERTGRALRSLVGGDDVYPYHFSSLTQREIERNALERWRGGNEFLCVGQYARYKGLDVLIDAFARLPEERLTIIGTSSKTDELRSYVSFAGANNVKVIPFLQKEELRSSYRNCKAFVLPSRQECWGLVVNEAASFGVPIIATRGVGAARDFLDDDSPFFVGPESATELVRAVMLYDSLDSKAKKDISDDLLRRSSCYTVERTVEEHAAAFDFFLSNS